MQFLRIQVVAMTNWKPQLNTAINKKYLAIVDALEADIYAGRLKAGERLPSQRAIAEHLSVDLTTVTRAFNEARRRGLVEGNAGRGSYVRNGIEKKLLADKVASLDLSMNNPPQPTSANLQQLIPEGIAGVISDQRRMLQLQYQESLGNAADRDAATYWLTERYPSVSVDRVMITGGAQTALYAICKQLFEPHSVVVTSVHTYPGLKSVAEQLSLSLVAAESDVAGILPASLESLCQSHAVKALYLIPGLDNPTTLTIPLERRQALVSIAKRYQIAILEDDPYYSLQTHPVTPFVQLYPENTWYITTLSKCATPALRVAFVIAPTSSLLIQLAGVVRGTSLMAPPLMSALVTRWIYDGTLNDIAEAIRIENHQRQALTAKILHKHQFNTDMDGHHIWLSLPVHWQADEFALAAEKLGVTIVSSKRFEVCQSPVQAVRVSLGLAVDHKALAEALGILDSLLSQLQPLNRAVV